MRNGQSKIDKLHDKARIAFLAYFRSLRFARHCSNVNKTVDSLILQFRQYRLLHKGE